MKKSPRTVLGLGAVLLGVLLLTSCTANFTTNSEKARMLYEIDPGISVYASKSDAEHKKQELEDAYKELHKDDEGEWPVNVRVEQVFKENDNLYRYVPVNEDGQTPAFSKVAMQVRLNFVRNAFYVPTTEYFMALDTEVLKKATEQAIRVAEAAHLDPSYISSGKGDPCLYIYDEIDEPFTAYTLDERHDLVRARMTSDQASQTLKQYGYMKFYCDPDQDGKNPDTLWTNYRQINLYLRLKLGDENVASEEFERAYMKEMDNAILNLRSSIATTTGDYGSYGDDGQPIHIEAKSWGYAWSRGPIEGLLVYPVAWLVDSLTAAFGGDPTTGWPQIGALILVTIIVRLFLFLCTFKSTFAQKKMQQLQPELAKLQMKYPNANTNQAEKQRLAQEQMALYKKHKINPFSQFFVILIQFPIFIGVWGAMTGSAVLSTGALLGMQLSRGISAILFDVSALPGNGTGWWTALFLFILMGVAQFLSMKLPMWIQKARTKKISRLTKNPAADKQQKTMKMMSWFMLIMIIVMGFSLPAAMGIYWLIGAIISMLQTLIIQYAGGNDKHKKAKRPRKAGKRRQTA